MRLSSKALVVVGTTIVALVVALHFASRNEIQERFERLEALYASKAIGRTEALIQQNVESLRDLAADWGAWTDMWRYMGSGDRTFEASNLTEASLKNLEMNYRVITDGSGRVVSSDVLGDGVFVPRSANFEGALKAGEAHRRGMMGEETSGVAVVDGMVVLYAAHPIVMTSRKGPVRGVLAFGRALTPARVAELSRLTRHQIEIEPQVTSLDGLGEVVSGLEHLEMGQASASKGVRVYLNRRDAKMLAASVVLKDARGADVAVVRALQPRGVMAEGQATLTRLQVIFVGAGVLMGVMILLAIEFGIVRRLRWIQRDIRAIDPLAPGARRVRVRGNDEVAAVATALNTALASVEAARDRLRASEQTFRAMSESSPIGIFMCDATGKLVYCNATLRQLLGTSHEQSTGFGWIRRIHPEDRAEVARGWEACVRVGDPFHHEHRVLHEDGSVVWVRVNAAPVRRGRGVAGYVGTCDDITERMQQDEALRAAIDAARSASEAKTSFLANMSHEIRTPMAAMLGFIELLDDPEVTAQGRTEAMATIRRNGEQLLALINDILDVSKIEAGAMRIEEAEFDLPRVLGDVVSLFRPIASKKGLGLSLEFATPMPSLVVGDGTRVRQVVSNLVSNAVKFTATGSVRVVASMDAGRAGLVRLRVIDTGIGMSPDVVSRLFVPFTQADVSMTRRFGGTGLGLSISHQLTRMMGGDLTVDSNEGEGSVFEATFGARAVSGTNWIAMPIPVVSAIEPTDLHGVEAIGRSASTGGTDQDARGIGAAEARASGGLSLATAGPVRPIGGILEGVRVLVAEDGADNRRLVHHYLTRAGAIVEMVEDGEDAVAFVRGRRDWAQLVLMDIQMPRMDGYQATRTLRQSGFTRPIIALTAHAMSEDRERCMAAGCDAYMSKPLNRGDLLELCGRLVRGGATEAA